MKEKEELFNQAMALLKGTNTTITEAGPLSVLNSHLVHVVKDLHNMVIEEIISKKPVVK